MATWLYPLFCAEGQRRNVTLQFNAPEDRNKKQMLGAAKIMNARTIRFSYVASALIAIVIGGCVTTPQNVQVSAPTQKTTFSGFVLVVIDGGQQDHLRGCEAEARSIGRISLRSEPRRPELRLL
jgi:hypothetical protein